MPPFVYEQNQLATEPSKAIKQKRTYKPRKQFLESDNSLDDGSENATHDDQPGEYSPMDSSMFACLLVSIVGFALDGEVESSRILVNHWDIGEGRLRPRSMLKSNTDPHTHPKVKCDICTKFYRADYIKVRCDP